MRNEFIDFLINSKKYGFGSVVRDLININKLYLQKKYVNDILKFSEKYNLKFTFFMTGKNLSKKENIIKKIKELDHEIGSHSYHHVLHEKLSYKEIYENISKAQKEFEKFGIKPQGFRAPFLSMNPEVIEVLKKLNFKYSSNIQNKQPFLYENNIWEASIISPYDWEGLIALNWKLNDLMNKWKGKKGTLLLHPWVISSRLNKLMDFGIIKENKDYRIKNNLKSFSISFDVY